MVCVDVWPAVTDAKEASDTPFDPLEERACPNCGEFGFCIVPVQFWTHFDPIADEVCRPNITDEEWKEFIKSEKERYKSDGARSA